MNDGNAVLLIVVASTSLASNQVTDVANASGNPSQGMNTLG
jgi:hypothetical protein